MPISQSEKLPFYILTILSALLYLILSLNKPGIGYQQQSIVLTTILVIYVLIFFFKFYETIPVRVIFILSFIFSLILFLSPLRLYSDTSIYILWGRISALGKMNPYIHPYTDFVADPIFSFFKNYLWAKETALYSPLFILLSNFFVIISKGSFFLNQIYFKTLFFLSFVLSVPIFWRLTKNKSALYLYSLNPIVLFEFVKESHAESLIAPLLLLTVLLTVKSKYKSAIVLATLISLIKISYVIFIPFLIIFATKKRRHFLIYLLKLLLIIIILYAVFYIPFIGSGDVLIQIFRRLLRSGSDLYSLNPLVLLFFPLTWFFSSNFWTNYTLAGKLSTTLGGFLYLVLVYKSLFKHKQFKTLIYTFCLSYLIYVFAILNYFMPYYVPMGVLLLSIFYSFNPKSKLYWLIFVMSLYASFYYQLLS